MTVITPAVTQANSTGSAPGRARIFCHTLSSEWSKLRTVRSTIWSLLALVIVAIGFTTVFSELTVSNWDHTDPVSLMVLKADPTSFILGVGISLGQLAICVLGVMVITSEYSTGMIRASLLAVPGRTEMLVAKCVVFAAVVLVVSEIVAFISFFIGAYLLKSHVSVSLSDPGVLRAVLGAGLYLTVLGLFSLAIGGIIRHTAGSITAVIAAVLVVFNLLGALPGNWGKYLHGYSPTAAGGLIAQAHRADGDLMGPWQGFGIFCLWTAVLLIIAGFLLKTRDA